MTPPIPDLVVLDEFTAIVASDVDSIKKSDNVGQSIVYLRNGRHWEVLATFEETVEAFSGVRPRPKPPKLAT